MDALQVVQRQLIIEQLCKLGDLEVVDVLTRADLYTGKPCLRLLQCCFCQNSIGIFCTLLKPATSHNFWLWDNAQRVPRY